MENLILYFESKDCLRDIPNGKEYIYIVLVEGGSAYYRMEDTDYVAHAGDILVLIHNKGVARTRVSEDYKARVALLARNYVEYLNVRQTHRMFLSLRRNPILHLDGESQGLIMSCFDLISRTKRSVNNSYRRETIYYAVKTYLFTLAYLSQPENARSLSREEEITMQFLDMLEESYREEHSVMYYAERLHLTPKYLSSCVKQTTGKPAIDRIAERLMTQAIKLLIQQDMSISEICYHLGFGSPSSFGKFFRTHAHMGPKQYRLNAMREDTAHLS